MRRIVQTEAANRPAAWFAWLVAVVFVIPLAGCMSSPAAVDILTPAGASIRQRGAAEAPAAVESTRTQTETPLPAGSAVTIAPDGAVSIVLTAPAPLRTVTTHENATAAKTFAPPSPADAAAGWGLRVWGLVGAGLFVLALVLGARGHVKAGVIAGFGAVLAPIVGRFVNSTAGLVVAGIGIAGSVALFAAWHLMRTRRLELEAPEVAPGPG